MSKTIRRAAILLITFVIAFTSLPVVDGGLDAHAAAVKAPAQVKKLKDSSKTQTSVKIVWSKIKKNKNTKGYAIYRNGKLIKRVSYKTNTFNVVKLKAGTKYKFTVRAYNTYKQKQYYNSKTKKWQTKKPTKKQWKGKKTRKVTAYKYGKASTPVSVTTKAASVEKSYNNAQANAGNSTGDSSDHSSSNSGQTTSGNTVVIDKDPTFTSSYLPSSATYNLSDGSATFTIKSKHGVSWSSSNPAVATTSSGLASIVTNKITFVGPGTTIITAKSKASGAEKTMRITIIDDRMDVTDIAFSLCYYGANYPGEDAKNPKNNIKYNMNGNELLENSYFVLQAYLYPNYGENTTKPTTWTIKENTIGATTEVKGRNLIIKTPKYTSRDQFNGKLIVEMSAGGLSKEYKYKPAFPMITANYEELLDYEMTPDIKRVFLWQDNIPSDLVKEEIKATVATITAGCTNDRQKVERIIEWHSQNIEYDRNFASSSYSIQGTWINKRGVCSGQAGLIAQMLRYADIPAGRYSLEESYNHAVTVFWMDGEWYGTDGTSYDGGDKPQNGGYARIAEFENVVIWLENPLPGGMLVSGMS